MLTSAISTELAGKESGFLLHSPISQLPTSSHPWTTPQVYTQTRLDEPRGVATQFNGQHTQYSASPTPFGASTPHLPISAPAVALSNHVRPYLPYYGGTVNSDDNRVFLPQPLPRQFPTPSSPQFIPDVNENSVITVRPEKPITAHQILRRDKKSQLEDLFNEQGKSLYAELENQTLIINTASHSSQDLTIALGRTAFDHSAIQGTIDPRQLEKQPDPFHLLRLQSNNRDYCAIEDSAESIFCNGNVGCTDLTGQQDRDSSYVSNCGSSLSNTTKVIPLTEIKEHLDLNSHANPACATPKSTADQHSLPGDSFSDQDSFITQDPSLTGEMSLDDAELTGADTPHTDISSAMSSTLIVDELVCRINRHLSEHNEVIQSKANDARRGSVSLIPQPALPLPTFPTDTTVGPISSIKPCSNAAHILSVPVNSADQSIIDDTYDPPSEDKAENHKPSESVAQVNLPLPTDTMSPPCFNCYNCSSVFPTYGKLK
ncbi:hypothetical protein GQ44DRAFT_732303 [Phaeosphaeriaceae sp. PMI808]|nr:hypothetical protein GQ44DRAFT_732303 [Phaeosphaeriaceae sp. PMI808]